MGPRPRRAPERGRDPVAYAFEGLRGTVGIRRWWGDFVRECWFLVSVTALPVLLISVPLAATVSLQVGDLARQLGAQSATGSIIGVVVIREVAPMATAVITAGGGGTAMSADMGARRSATSSTPSTSWASTRRTAS